MLTLISVNLLINTDENVTLKIKNKTITNKSNQKLFVYFILQKGLPKVKCSCKSCALYELRKTKVNYECIHLFAVWILFAGMDIS